MGDSGGGIFHIGKHRSSAQRKKCNGVQHDFGQ